LLEVDDWKEETRRDLIRADRSLATLTESVSGEPGPEQLRALWEAYLLVEKSVTFIKLELDEENPGRFVNPKVYAVPDERQATVIALKFLRRAETSFGKGDLMGSLGPLREARNYLRVLLKEKRRLRIKKARAASKPT